jgi:uncharacterized DUF497 family protein
VKFEWNDKKAASNENKHRVTFDEAMTVFGDWESITIEDPDHSARETRYLILGMSSRARILVCRTLKETRRYGSSAHDGRTLENEKSMASKTRSGEEMRSHYDFSHGVRGKYAARYGEGANVIVLAPDVAEIFRDSVAVNEALRTLVRISGKTHRSTPAKKKRGA